MKEHYLRMKMPESQGVPLLSNLESQFRFTIKYNRVYTCVSKGIGKKRCVRKELEGKGMRSSEKKRKGKSDVSQAKRRKDIGKLEL